MTIRWQNKLYGSRKWESNGDEDTEQRNDRIKDSYYNLTKITCSSTFAKISVYNLEFGFETGGPENTCLILMWIITLVTNFSNYILENQG